MKTSFEYIIYGASLSGCFLANKLAGEGKDVLLINSYGFPGGSITESLNCLQYTETFENDELNSFFDKLKNSNRGLLFHDDTKSVINPETIKYQLQRFISGSNITLLFHARPVQLKRKDNKKKISVSLREGIIEFECDKVFDMTDNCDLLRSLFQFKPEYKRCLVNCIITKIDESEIIAVENINQIQQLDYGRLWISFEFPFDKSVKYIQKFLDEFSEILLKAGSRIQLLPSHYIHELENFNNPFKDELVIKSDLMDKKFELSKLFMETDSLLNSKILNRLK